MSQFRKKPLLVEATQWWKNGDHPEDPKGTEVEGKVVRYFRHPAVPGETICRHCSIRMHEHGWIDTKQGGHTVCPGDWIITQPGTVPVEYYPCKPDIFAATYDACTGPFSDYRDCLVHGPHPQMEKNHGQG